MTDTNLDQTAILVEGVDSLELRMELETTEREMKNDNHQPLVSQSWNRSSAGLHWQLSQIQKFRVSRSHVLEWANDLRFVTWDAAESEGSVETPLKHPKDLFPCNCRWHESPAIGRFGNVEDCSCARLNRTGETAFEGFDLVRAPGCCHYIAISYRWQYLPSAEAVGSAKDVDPGRQSPSTLATTLQRSARFARHHGYKLIWIDEIGIKQDDEEQKAIGVQAMDIVYEKAAMCLAVLQYSVTSQEQLDDLVGAFEACIGPWTEWEDCQERERTERQTRRDCIEDLDIEKTIRQARALRALVEDEYFTRSWTAQENVVASITVVLIRCSPGLKAPPWMGKLPGEMQVPLCLIDLALTSLVDIMSQYCDEYGEYVVDKREKALFGRYCHRGRMAYRPPRRAEGHVEQHASAFGGHSKEFRELYWQLEGHGASQTHREKHGKRKICSAAEAVSFLATKHNFEVADRLAIISNLCGYNVRLDSQRLKNYGFGLAACTLCLAFLNGDLSLGRLSDEVKYQDLGTKPLTWNSLVLLIGDDLYNEDRIMSPQVGPVLFSWGPRLMDGLAENFRRRRKDRLYKTAVLGKHAPSLCIQGSLWRRYRKLDCDHLKKAFKRRLPRASDETTELSLPEKWSMPVIEQLNCFWEIIIMLRGDPELQCLVQDLWQALWNANAYMNKPFDLYGSIEQTTVPEEQLEPQHYENIHNVSSAQFHEALELPKGPIIYLFWMIQTIYQGNGLHVFKLDQFDQKDPPQSRYFALVNETHGDTMFVPSIQDIQVEDPAFEAIYRSIQYSWKVHVESTRNAATLVDDLPQVRIALATTGDRATALEGLPPSFITLDKRPLPNSNQPKDPFVGFWGTRTIPKEWFVLL